MIMLTSQTGMSYLYYITFKIGRQVEQEREWHCEIRGLFTHISLMLNQNLTPLLLSICVMSDQVI